MEMKKSEIQKEVITKYFVGGESVTPSADQKLLNSLFPFMETKTTEFITEIAIIRYKTARELEAKFQEIIVQFNGLLNPFDLYAE